ncbi:hypothetical protein ACFWGP_05360 [Agromyces sp. NPDC127015]|uniref:hypothetical protein n=1 Tax=Agromyces sp. NPDC127015 TaxID=3347108 RepID=UPI003658CF6F
MDLIDDDPLIDDEALIYRLFTRDIPPDHYIASEVDVTTWELMPYGRFSCITDGGGNGPGIWHTILSVNVFGNGTDEAFAYARELDRIIRNWGDPGVAVLPGLGSVESAEREQKFTRVGSVEVNGKNVTQYLGTYELTLRYQPPTSP